MDPPEYSYLSMLLLGILVLVLAIVAGWWIVSQRNNHKNRTGWKSENIFWLNQPSRSTSPSYSSSSNVFHNSVGNWVGESSSGHTFHLGERCSPSAHAHHAASSPEENIGTVAGTYSVPNTQREGRTDSTFQYATRDSIRTVVGISPLTDFYSPICGRPLVASPNIPTSSSPFSLRPSTPTFPSQPENEAEHENIVSPHKTKEEATEDKKNSQSLEEEEQDRLLNAWEQEMIKTQEEIRKSQEERMQKIQEEKRKEEEREEKIKEEEREEKRKEEEQEEKRKEEEQEEKKREQEKEQEEKRREKEKEENEEKKREEDENEKLTDAANKEKGIFPLPMSSADALHQEVAEEVKQLRRAERKEMDAAAKEVSKEVSSLSTGAKTPDDQLVDQEVADVFETARRLEREADNQVAHEVAQLAGSGAESERETHTEAWTEKADLSTTDEE